MDKQPQEITSITPGLLEWSFIIFVLIAVWWLLIRILDHFLHGLKFTLNNRIYFFRIAPYLIVADIFVVISFFTTVLVGVGGLYDDIVNKIFTKIFHINQSLTLPFFFINLFCLIGILSPSLINIRTIMNFLLLLRDKLSK